MIQFNLLPDIKLEYLKTKKMKRSVVLGAISVTGLSIFVFGLMFSIVNVAQKVHIKNLNKNIAEKTNQLKQEQDIDKMLTVQNQMKSLTGLHESKPSISRLTDFLITLSPADVKVSDVTVDFTGSTFIINGTADTYESINRFVDTLKYTEYKNGDIAEKAFSDVVLTNYGSAKSTGRTSYGINLIFASTIFDNTKDIKLVIPNKVTTQSVIEAPSDLFEPKSNEVNPTQQGAQ